MSANNNSHEYLFWKVFHNKYLLNLIIQHIHNIEWVIYDDHSKLHINNRLKLNDIRSLEFMLKNKLYSLLNYKLDNNHYIQIDRESITTLFNQLSSSINNSNNDNNNNNNNNSILKEILIKLLSTRRDEFEITDLTFEAVQFNSIEILRILSNEVYSIPIYPSTLEYAIQNCHPSIVDEILKINSNNYLCRNNNEAFNKIKEESFDLASFNNKYQTEMIEYLLYNFNLPPPPKTTTTTTTTQLTQEEEEEEEQPKKKLKLSTTTTTSTLMIVHPDSNTKTASYDYKPTNSELPTGESITQVKSYSIIQILNSRFKDLNFVDIPYDDLLSIYKLIKIEPINQDDDDDFKLSLKELQQFIIIKLKKEKDLGDQYQVYYKSYIRKYRELINECHDNEEAGGTDDSGDILKFKQFFKIIKIFKCIDDNDVFDHFKRIINDYCKNARLVWNEILIELAIVEGDEIGRTVMINDRSVVDWILNCKNEPILWFIKKQFYRITFSTLELANYVYKESDFINHLHLNDNEDTYLLIYYHVWNEAIKQSDFNTIHNIESSLIDQQHLRKGLFNLTEYSTLTIDQTIKLINYLNNETGFNGLNKYSFKLLFNHLFSCDGGIEYYSNLKLNFNLNDPQNVNQEIIIEAMNSFNFKLIELLLNSNIFDNIEIIDYEKFSENCVQTLIIFNQIGNVHHHTKISREGDGNGIIIELIKKTLSKIKPTSKTCDKIEVKNPISIMVNYFFKLLIQIKGITMDEVKEVYELIQQHSIIIEHDLYHSFWYLHIKDIKLTRYITAEYYLSIFFKTDGREDYYNCSEYNGNNYLYQDNWIYLEDYLKSSEFTFQLIYNQSFDTVLQMIIDSLSPLLFNNQFNINPDKFKNHLNWELEFYLIIKRNDLFFKKLEYIKNLLDIENEKQDQDTDDSSNLFSKSVILFYSLPKSLLPTSKLMNQDSYINYSIVPNVSLKLIENFKKYEFQPIEPLAYTFEFTVDLLKSICKVLEVNEIIQVIKFNYYQPGFHKYILYFSIFQNRFDIIKLIFDNFDLSTLNFNRCSYEPLSFILNNYFNLIKSPYHNSELSNTIEIKNKLFKIKFLQLFENYLQDNDNQDILNQFISPTTSFQTKYQIIRESYNNIKSTNIQNEPHFLVSYICSSDGSNNLELIELFHKDEYQSLFSKFFKDIQKQEQQELNSSTSTIEYNEIEDNIFLRSFIDGDIKLCELILSFYQQTFNFKITNHSITQTIHNNNIHIIIYFLKNHKNMWSTDSINHLKSELKNHKNYKYLNLLE